MKRLTPLDRGVLRDAAQQILEALERDENEPPNSYCYVTVNVDKVCIGFDKADYERLIRAVNKL